MVRIENNNLIFLFHYLRAKYVNAVKFKYFIRIWIFIILENTFKKDKKKRRKKKKKLKICCEIYKR